MCVRCSEINLPEKLTSPEVIDVFPVNIYISVVFPAPFGPSRVNNSPFLISRKIFLTA